MPLPRQLETISGDVRAVQDDLDTVQASIDALPATPLEADLPAIVDVVKALREITATLATSTEGFIEVVKTTRINS